jgi:hypothetical protein
MSDEFTTDKMIMMCYPPGAGGKFLCNSLGLGSNVVLAGLAEWQIDNQVSAHDKFELLCNRLDDVKGQWNDLNLGARPLFVSDTESRIKPTIYWAANSAMTTILKKVIEQNLYFFLPIHTDSDKQKILSRWSNANKIYLYEETGIFFDRYRPGYGGVARYWQSVRAETWPITAPRSIDELRQLPTHIQDELEKLNNNEIYNQFLFCDDATDGAKWNIDWFVDEDATIFNLEKLYDHFDIENFNSNLIRRYHSKWLSVLTRLNASETG